MGRRIDADFERFYRDTRDGCYRALLATCGEAHEADDLLAEAYTRALAGWSKVRAHPAPAAWVVRTALNLRHDEWRRSSRPRRLRRETVVGPPEPPIDPRVLAAVRSLPDRQREVVALRVLVGLSGEQTADALGIDAGTVGTHLRRALASLRSELHPQGPDEPCSVPQGSEEPALQEVPS